MLDMVTVTLIKPNPPRRYTPAPRRAIMPALNLDIEAIRRAGMAMQNSIDLARIKFPANLAHIHQMQKGVGEAMMRHAEQVRAAFKNAGISRMIEIAQQIAAKMADVAEAVREGKQLSRSEFKRLYPTVKHYLKRQGMILPTGADEFLTWFLYEKHGHRSFADILGNWPSITRADFIEFHEYQLAEMPAAVVGPLRPAPRPKFAALAAPRVTPDAELPTLATARQVALFYVYLLETDTIKRLEDLAPDGTKTAAFAELEKRHRRNAKNIEKQLRELLYDDSRGQTRSLKKDIEQVLIALSANDNYHRARELAKDELDAIRRAKKL